MKIGIVKLSHIKDNQLKLDAGTYLGREDALETKVTRAEKALKTSRKRLKAARARLAADRQRTAELERTGAVTILEPKRG